MVAPGARRRLVRRAVGTTRAQQAPVSRPQTGRGPADGHAPMGPRIVSALTAFIAAGALVISALSLKVTRDGQTAAQDGQKEEQKEDRFDNAVEKLGSASEDTRVGAVYILRQLALDSDRDRPIITEQLIDFVRARTELKSTPATGPVEYCRHAGATPREVKAALRVLLYDLRGERRVHRVDLRRVCLNDVDLPGADLTCVGLDSAVIFASNFEKSNFTRAALPYANLEDSQFMNADFTGATANGVTLGETRGGGSADMRGAVLRDADLSDAQIVEVDLSDADLTRTILTRADMSDSVVTEPTLPTYLGDVASLPPGVARVGTLASRPPSPSFSPCFDS